MWHALTNSSLPQTVPAGMIQSGSATQCRGRATEKTSGVSQRTGKLFIFSFPSH